MEIKETFESISVHFRGIFPGPRDQYQYEHKIIDAMEDIAWCECSAQRAIA
jgi:hypothetical protein